MHHTGAGKASCVGGGGRVANFAEYRIQLPESATPTFRGCHASLMAFVIKQAAAELDVLSMGTQVGLGRCPSGADWPPWPG